MKMIAEKIANIQQAVAEFHFSAVVASNDLIIVRNKKTQICAEVTDTGVIQKYIGGKNLCGSLVRNAIIRAISI
jgi:hypothetical protein